MTQYLRWWVCQFGPRREPSEADKRRGGVERSWLELSNGLMSMRISIHGDGRVGVHPYTRCVGRKPPNLAGRWRGTQEEVTI